MPIFKVKKNPVILNFQNDFEPNPLTDQELTITVPETITVKKLIKKFAKEYEEAQIKHHVYLGKYFKGATHLPLDVPLNLLNPENKQRLVVIQHTESGPFTLKIVDPQTHSKYPIDVNTSHATLSELFHLFDWSYFTPFQDFNPSTIYLFDEDDGKHQIVKANLATKLSNILVNKQAIIPGVSFRFLTNDAKIKEFPVPLDATFEDCIKHYCPKQDFVGEFAPEMLYTCDLSLGDWEAAFHSLELVDQDKVKLWETLPIVSFQPHKRVFVPCFSDVDDVLQQFYKNTISDGEYQLLIDALKNKTTELSNEAKNIDQQSALFDEEMKRVKRLLAITKSPERMEETQLEQLKQQLEINLNELEECNNICRKRRNKLYILSTERIGTEEPQIKKMPQQNFVSIYHQLVNI